MNKYRAQKIQAFDSAGNVITFDSKKEYARWQELTLMERGKVISNLRRQVAFELVPRQKRADGKTERPVVYIADFVYTDVDGREVVEDVKGYRDPQSAGYAKFVIKRKLMLAKYGISVKEV